ncbi:MULTISPECIES: response regulator [Dactylosporangium]|uniref:DNA-binding response regulator n=2 Tax=Dactylosporangium TaxID=35753 RepID=A0A9W6KJE4_9ACTN|nr:MULTISPECIES: response regulator transcription factor [Dactylosporangium]UAB93240.1 response regulator transcription factor [Dactylosporangium vinaceum]UWZ41627.1 response regulator transcription factor [Dactylosporangium matsuzakiense]GLL02298.1 DNA-binding response regulator [Dactylosporangium matsuzakiense]
MIRVLVADDEWMVRAMLRTILEADGDIAVVAEAADGAEVVALAKRHRPDVTVVDIRMPGTDGLTATRALRRLPHPPAVVVLTTFDIDEYVRAALRYGAVGFLLKDATAAEMTAAVRAAAGGDAMLAPRVTRRLLETLAGRDTPERIRAERRLERLTAKEREVLTAVAEGLPNADIAARLRLSEATVKTHVSRILTKLELGNRVQAAILAHRAGLGGG